MAIRFAQVTNPRYRAVPTAAAALIDYERPRRPGLGVGVALVESWGSIVAEAVEVEVNDMDLKILRVACAFDCGVAIHPGSVRAQAEGAITYGLSAAIYGRINISSGRVVQGNFDDYQVMRMANMPQVDVAIVASGADIGGVGEPGLPPLASALANAIFAASDRRIRSLPLTDHGYRII